MTEFSEATSKPIAQRVADGMKRMREHVPLGRVVGARTADLNVMNAYRCPASCVFCEYYYTAVAKIGITDGDGPEAQALGFYPYDDKPSVLHRLLGDWVAFNREVRQLNSSWLRRFDAERYAAIASAAA